MSVLVFCLSALRAIVEMLGLALLAQGALALLAGSARNTNPIYQLFALITRRPRLLCGKLIPGVRRPWWEGALCFALLAMTWIALAAWRLALLTSVA